LLLAALTGFLIRLLLLTGLLPTAALLTTLAALLSFLLIFIGHQVLLGLTQGVTLCMGQTFPRNAMQTAASRRSARLPSTVVSVPAELSRRKPIPEVAPSRSDAWG
jgi:hypothetical protein